MNIVGKRAEPGNPGHSFSAATFRKVLKGFEIGDLPYTEVKFQLKRLLSTASPGELREVLRRSESTEPLPEYAYREVQSLLNEAIEHNAPLQAEPAVAIDQEEELDPAALSAELVDTRSALESEQTRAREAEEALSERIASEEAVRSRLDATLRESERYQAELRAARNSLASRDKVAAQMRQILDERGAELVAIRREYAELTAAALESRGVSSEQVEADLQAVRARETLAERDAQLAVLQSQHAEALASLKSSGDSAAQLRSDLHNSRAQVTSLTSDLAAVRSALDGERRKSQGLERSLTDSNSLNGSVRESLASQEKALAGLRQTLSERDAQLVAQQREHAATLASERRKNSKAIGDLDARAQNLEDKLQAAKKRADVLKQELKASDDANAAVNSQVAKLQAKQRDGDALIEKLNASARDEAKRAAQWQAQARQRQAPAGVSAEGAPAEGAPASSPLPDSALNDRTGRRLNFRAAPRTVWVGAATLLLAAAVWFVLHRSPPVVSGPALPTTALAQPDAPVPVPMVLPAGQSVGSGEGENAAAAENPPMTAPTAAAGKPVAATVRLKTDFARCRAGGNLEACYDAIRRRPSDPALLSALGDALLRANRPADALRTYQRLATLAPNTPGVAEKITTTEAKISAKGGPRKASTQAAPQTQSR
jgi:chromosome segregation ATPase